MTSAKAAASSEVRQQVEAAVEQGTAGDKVRPARIKKRSENRGSLLFFNFSIIGRSSATNTFREERERDEGLVSGMRRRNRRRRWPKNRGKSLAETEQNRIRPFHGFSGDPDGR